MSALFRKSLRKFFAVLFVIAGFLFTQNEASAAVTYFSSASNPVDSATATLATTPAVVTPPASMLTGDLVIMVASTLTTGITPAISATGGQTWTAQTANTANASQRIFWATYNGTWSANPSVSFSTSANTTLAMHVFRPTASTNTWAIDVAQTNTTFASPAAPRDVTVTGITTNTNGALVFATWATGDDNTWGLQTAGWTNAGTAQYRNVANSDSSQSSAYKIMATAGASGNVTNRQLTLGGDNGNSSILAFKEVDANSPTPNPMTFASVPANDSASQISMTATAGSDATPPINYLFTNNNTNCGSNAGTGGASSAWQSSTVYSNSGLQANKCYGYTVTARDSVTPTPNTGTASGISSTYTSANVPGTPTLTGATTNSLNLTNAENGNPASNPTTNFAVQVVTTSDATWLNKWVNASGNASATAVWMTDTQLDALVLQGLQSNTLYGVKVKARNNDTDETALSAEGQGTTSTPYASGTVSASPSSCTISSSASTCAIPFTWNIVNATSPNLFNSTIPVTYSTSASGSGVAETITNGSNTVQARDGATVLNAISVTGSCTLGTAWNGSICSAITFAITASSGANGTVTPTGITTVAQGGSQEYAITPNSGYDVATLLIDGGSIATSTSYTFTNVQANHTISATFVALPPPPITHTITSSAGSNGSVVPLGATVVVDGVSQGYSINPEGGFTIETLIVDSVSIATSTSYTFSNVTTDHTISATFALIPPPPGSFTIIATSGTHGAVLPSGSTVVTQGNSQAYTITPDTGYDVATLVIDSFPVATSTTYTFTNVQTAHTIEATFSALPSEAPTSGRRLASITFSGKAFPEGKVSIVQKELGTEKIVSQQDVSKVDGSFQLRFVDLPEGVHSFGLLVKDPNGRTSQTKFFLVDAKDGDETYKNIVFPPTVDILSGQVSRGSNAKVFGYASPGHTIRLYLNDILTKEVLAGRGGVYSFELPTGALPFGQYTVRAKQINLDGGKESDFSTSRTFIVSKLAVVKADWNGDGKIDIKDWSIFLARFTSRDKEMRTSVDLNGDGKTDISDFSIFIRAVRRAK